MRVEEDEDTLIVHGMGPGGVPGGATGATHLDHRIAMSFLCLRPGVESPGVGRRRGPIVTSFPVFEALMRGLGGDLSQP